MLLSNSGGECFQKIQRNFRLYNDNLLKMFSSVNFESYSGSTTENIWLSKNSKKNPAITIEKGSLKVFFLSQIAFRAI